MQLKSLGVLVCLLSFAGSAEAALTKTQLDQVESSVNQMQITLTKMMRLAVNTENAVVAGNQFTTEFSTVPFTLSSQQQQDIVTYYQSLKTQLQTQYSTLP